MVAHAVELGEEDTPVVALQPLLIHQPCKPVIARFVVAAHENLHPVDMLHRERHAFVKIGIGGLFRGAYRVGIPHCCSPCTLLLHISAAHELHAGHTIRLPDIFVQPAQIGQPVAAVHLERGEYDGPSAVVPVHGLLRQPVHRILEPDIFGIDEYPHPMPVSQSAERIETRGECIESGTLRSRERLRVLRCLGQQGIRRKRRRLEHRVGNVLVTSGILYRTFGLGENRLDSHGRLFALGRVVESRLHTRPFETVHRRPALLERLSADELPVKGRFHNPPHRQMQPGSRTARPLAGLHEAGPLHHTEEHEGVPHLTVAFTGECGLGIVEIQHGRPLFLAEERIAEIRRGNKRLLDGPHIRPAYQVEGAARLVVGTRSS